MVLICKNWLWCAYDTHVFGLHIICSFRMHMIWNLLPCIWCTVFADILYDTHLPHNPNPTHCVAYTRQSPFLRINTTSFCFIWRTIYPHFHEIGLIVWDVRASALDSRGWRSLRVSSDLPASFFLVWFICLSHTSERQQRSHTAASAALCFANKLLLLPQWLVALAF